MKSHIAFAQRLVTLMDTKFNLFGIRFSIDPILDILPGFGNAIGVIVDLFYRSNTKNLALLSPFIDQEVLERVVVES